jgi:hypothetical protein
MKKKYVIAALISYLLLVLITFYFKLGNTAFADGVIRPLGDSTIVNQKQMMFFGSDEMGELRIESAVFNFRTLDGKTNGQLSPNYQIVKFNLIIRNIGDKDFHAESFLPYMKLADGSVGYKMPTNLVSDSEVSDIIKLKTLTPGERIVGAMYFEIPKSETVKTLKFCFDNHYNDMGDEKTVVLGLGN